MRVKILVAASAAAAAMALVHAAWANPWVQDNDNGIETLGGGDNTNVTANPGAAEFGAITTGSNGVVNARSTGENAPIESFNTDNRADNSIRNLVFSEDNSTVGNLSDADLSVVGSQIPFGGEAAATLAGGGSYEGSFSISESIHDISGVVPINQGTGTNVINVSLF